MKRKIRRTGEIIDVITFSSSTTRSDMTEYSSMVIMGM